MLGLFPADLVTKMVTGTMLTHAFSGYIIIYLGTCSFYGSSHIYFSFIFLWQGELEMVRLCVEFHRVALR